MLWSRLVIGRQTSALSRLSTAGFTFIPTLAVIMVLSRYFGAVARWQEGEHSISALELALGSLGVLVVAGVVFLGPLCIALLIRASIWRTYLTFLLTLASVQAFMICLQINVESMHRAHRWSESLKELRRDRVTEQWCLVDAKEGKVSEAIAKLQPILAARRRGLGDDSELTIALTANLGALLTFSDRLAEAEPLIMEAVERRRHLDPDHPASLTTTFYIGALRARQGRHAEAELALTHALAGFSRTLGTNDNMATSCTAELINLHRRWDEADPGRGHAATAAALQAQLDAKKTLSEAPEDVTASPKP
jgi:hypothetical protein